MLDFVGCTTFADPHCEVARVFLSLIPAIPFALALWHTNVEKSSTHVGSISLLSSQSSGVGAVDSRFHRRGFSSALSTTGGGAGVLTLSSSVYPECAGSSAHDLYLNIGVNTSFGRDFTPPLKPFDAPYGTLGRSLSRSQHFAYGPSNMFSARRNNTFTAQMEPLSAISTHISGLRRTKSATDVRADSNNSMNLRQFRERVFEMQYVAGDKTMCNTALTSTSDTRSTVSPLPLLRREGSNFSHAPPIEHVRPILSSGNHTSRVAPSVTVSSQSTSNMTSSNTRPSSALDNSDKSCTPSSPLKRTSSTSSLSMSAFSCHSNTKSEACSTTTTTISPRTSWMSPVLGPLLQRNSSRRVRIMHANHTVYRDSANSNGRNTVLHSIHHSHSARNLFSGKRCTTPPHHTWSLRRNRDRDKHKRSHTAHIEFERSLSRNRPTTPTPTPLSHPTHIKVPTSLGTLRLPYDPLLSRSTSHSTSRNTSTTPDRDFSMSQSVTKSVARSVTLTSPSTSGTSYTAGAPSFFVDRGYRIPQISSGTVVEICESDRDFYAQYGTRTRERAVTEPLNLHRSRSISSVSTSLITPSTCTRSRSSSADFSPSGRGTPYERSATLTVPGKQPNFTS